MQSQHLPRRRYLLLLLAGLALILCQIAIAQDDGKRLPEPDKAAQSRADAVVRKLFQDDLDKAKTDAAAARTLAGILFKEGKATVDDAALRYVALSLARDLAVRAGDTTLALAILEELARQYVMDTLTVKSTRLAQAADHVKTPEAAHELIQVALAALDEAVATDNYKPVAQLLSAAEKVVPRVKEGQLRLAAQLKKRGEEMQAAEKE